MAACKGLAPILSKFNDDEITQAGIARVIRKNYFKGKTYRKRQLFIYMVGGEMMNMMDLFEKYFKLDFLTLVTDPTDNVRVSLANILRNHFITESFGAFVYDEDMNDAVRLLK